MQSFKTASWCRNLTVSCIVAALCAGGSTAQVTSPHGVSGDPIRIQSPMNNAFEERTVTPDVDSSWSPVGVGTDREVYSVAQFGHKLIVGGKFSSAGGVAASHIAAWDGSSWSPLGTGTNDVVYALAVYGGKLVAGGIFFSAGGNDAYYIASWDGASWSPLGSYPWGTGPNQDVLALTIYEGKLIAGGWFTTAGGRVVNRIAAWDGVSWSPLGSGMSREDTSRVSVGALTVYDGRLIAGGMFTTAGGTVAHGIASWDGTSWSPLGSGVDYYSDPFVGALAVYHGRLYAGGGFDTAGGIPASSIASWDGISWSSLESGAGGVTGAMIMSLAVYNDMLIAGGVFSSVGGVPANNIASWDGNSWSPLGSGMRGWGHSLTVFEHSLIVGGNFTEAGSQSCNFIARWYENCCIGTTGNVDGDTSDAVDVSDLSAMVDYLFGDQALPETCFQEQDVDRSGAIDISDLQSIIDFLFNSVALPSCP